MVVRRLGVLSMLMLAVASASAQEPATRAEMLAASGRPRRSNSSPEPSGLEQGLLRLENGRFFERILNPPEGLYPKIGNITPGSGFSMGPGYRKPGLFGGHADFSTFAAISFTKYWMIDARLLMPRLAGGTLFFDVHGRRYDFPSEEFFGLGPESRREDSVSTACGARHSVLPAACGRRPG